MKTTQPLAFIVFLCVCTAAFADNANDEAEKLFNILGMESALEQSMSQMLGIKLQQNTNLEPFKQVMMQYFQKHMR